MSQVSNLADVGLAGSGEDNGSFSTLFDHLLDY
jgi:hypothetical protein